MTSAWFVLAVFVVLVVSLGVVVYLGHRRGKRLREYAAAHGLTYVKRDDRWASVDLGWPYGEGRSHTARNVMTGVYDGRSFVCFEHGWVTGSGDDRRSHTARVIALGLPRSLPKLSVGLEGVFGRVARRMGMKDIELESEQFNQQYRVHGDRRLAYDVLSPRLMHWMLEVGSGGFTISGPWLVYARTGTLGVAEIEESLRNLDAIADQLPGFVMNG